MRRLNLRPLCFLFLGLLIFPFGCSSAPESSQNDDGQEIRDAVETRPLAEDNQASRDEFHGEIETYLHQLNEAGFSGAVLVAQNGDILFEQGYGLADVADQLPNTPETVFDSGSLSKQFTAAAILHLAEKGLLQLDDTLSTFFADLPEDKAEITLHQLLTHTSGLPEYVYGGDFENIDREEAQQLALAANLEISPGTEYLYSDTGYGLLAIIIEIVSGQPFQTYLKQHLFDPAGMVHTGFYNDPQWTEQIVAHGYNSGQDFGSAATRPGPYWGILGFGGILTTVGDLYLWNLALKNNTVLNNQSVTRLFTPYIKEYPDGESYYGYGWVIEEIPEQGQLIWHDGATDSQNAVMLMYGDMNQTVVIVLSNRIDEALFSETFYGSDTGFSLGAAVLRNDFSSFPEYAH